ncbi:MAG: Trk system potassium transporter TrkA [Magnetococcales bacterium]|nr:Trk system potassium transporter TrkA [Magnetococcales bacterium]MBF0439063.1 Trk system potassium transporter TrkA [Magnetococcales bacterium]
MKIIIFGAGMVGGTIAQHLSIEGHDIHVIDSDPMLLHDLQERLNIRSLQGEADDLELLSEVDIKRADIVLAATDSDSGNIVISLIVNSLNANARIITWLRGEPFTSGLDIWRNYPLNEVRVISPEHSAVDMAMDLLEIPMSFEVVSFLNGRIRIAGFRLEENSRLVGQRLDSLDAMMKTRTLVVAVQRGGEVIIPTGQFVFEPADRIHVALIEGHELETHFEFMGLTFQTEIMKQTRITIAGGGRMAIHVASRLEKLALRPTVIECNPDRCEFLSMRLQNSVVIRGNATDGKVLREYVDSRTTFISLTGNEESNFTSSLLARRFGAKRAITMLDNEDYLQASLDLGVDAAIHPRLSAVGSVLNYIRNSKVLEASLLAGGKLEALLVEVQPGSRLAKHPVKDASIPKGVILAAAIKGGNILLPDGNMTFSPKDKVLLLTPHTQNAYVDDLTLQTR